MNCYIQLYTIYNTVVPDNMDTLELMDDTIIVTYSVIKSDDTLHHN